MLYRPRRWPGTSVYARVSFLRGRGQANAVPPDATAFVHRDNEWYMIWYLKWGRKDSKTRVAENLGALTRPVAARGRRYWPVAVSFSAIITEKYTATSG